MSQQHRDRHEIVIKVNKLRLILAILIGLGFVVLGTGLFFSATAQTKYPPAYIRTLGIVCVLFFGLSAGIGITRLFGRGPGLVLNEKGFIDYYSGLKGIVTWQSITFVKTLEIQSNKLLIIGQKDPQKIISKQSKYRQFWMQQNLNRYGGPICIAPGALSIKFDQLLKLIEESWKKYG